MDGMNLNNGNGASNSNSGDPVHDVVGQNQLALLLTDIIRKQEQAQQRQMQIMDRIVKSDGTCNRLGDFQKLKPPTFLGTSNPLEAEDWIVAMEKAFDAMDCTDNERVSFATYMLQSSAFEWWDAHRKCYEQGLQITWKLFKEAFYQKYFPESVKRIKEKEFLELKQGHESVSDYEIEFSRLARFAPAFVQTDSSKARRFESGLRQPLKRCVEAFELNSFGDVVNKAQLLEKGYHEEEEEVRQRPKKPKYDMHPPRGDSQEEGIFSGSLGQISNDRVLPCPICKRDHPPHLCPYRWGRCYKCGEAGHTQNRCPSLKSYSPIAKVASSKPALLPAPPQPLYLPGPPPLNNTTTSNSAARGQPNKGQKNRGEIHARICNIIGTTIYESDYETPGNM
ncbi:unnamed protein product [Alopecurus aequalis]